VTELLIAALTKAAERPSVLWRLAWLAFCFLVLCFFGARTFRMIVPYVLAGITEAPKRPTTTLRVDDDGRVTDWILPVISWLILGSILATIILYRR